MQADRDHAVGFLNRALPSAIVPRMPHALDGCRAKLDRAEQHLDALSAEIKKFVEAKTYEFVSEFSPVDQKTMVVTLKELRQIPLVWGVAVGDVVHNTRSSLDHLVYQLALLAGGKPHNRHQFPIFDHPNEWQPNVVQSPQQGKRGQLDFIDAVHVTSIERLQPYQPVTGKPRLAMLRRFSNTDKHRLIHGARASVSGTPQIAANLTIPSKITDLIAPAPGTPLEGGTQVARFRLHTDIEIQIDPVLGMHNPANSEMNVDAKLPTTVVFGPPGSEDTRVSDFRDAIGNVREIVESFASVFP